MGIIVVSQSSLHVGQPTSIEAASPTCPLGVVFEDDGETGYLYALEFERAENPICDALYIYNADNVVDRETPSVVKLAWSVDGQKALLLINDYPHAVFDFERRRGFCRSGFPPPDSTWTSHTHDWDDAAIELFS
jgi:hypothetical protein